LRRQYADSSVSLSAAASSTIWNLSLLDQRSAVLLLLAMIFPSALAASCQARKVKGVTPVSLASTTTARFSGGIICATAHSRNAAV